MLCDANFLEAMSATRVPASGDDSQLRPPGTASGATLDSGGAPTANARDGFAPERNS